MSEDDFDMIIDEMAENNFQEYSMNPTAQRKFNENDFKKVKVLGKGSYGKVYLVRLETEGMKQSGKLFAMKVLKKEELFKRK